MIAIVTLLVILILSVLITRIAAAALVHTGLSKDSARFQARSAFTGTGFTTTESENVVNHPVRRKILMILIILGSAGVISTISSLILSLISIERVGFFSIEIIVFIVGLLLLWILTQSDWIDRKLSIIINRALNNFTRLDLKDYYSLLHLSDNYRVSEISVDKSDWLSDKSLKELKLNKEGILVLGIKRKSGEYIGAPRGKIKVKEGDTITIYGRASVLEELGSRLKGLSGDQDHDDAVSEQERIWDKEDEKSDE